MSTPAVLLAIIATLLVGVVSPGPSFLLVSRISVAQSRAHGLAAAVGMGLGGTVFAGLALLGLAALLSQIAWLDSILKLAGGLYLIWLGIRIWQGATEPLPSVDAASAQDGTLLRSVVFGLLTQLSNPKTAVFYASVFAAMLPASPPASLLIALPPLVFAVEAGWYAIVALSLSAPYPRKLYLRAKPWADRLAGTLMGLLGLRLILDAVGARRS
ncbi:LysE family transporter [Bradyrhizobium lablabi]|uniref:LysE family translocator n=1 Tax=Bradyrhizobium lablabi TaxID=722472 RepID=UPI001BA6AD40|nr:LysE family transporter [Bradyrhizobium lablabi]MBR1121618.1 LysE family transporter [Bradyrhizobium lablabi]